MGDEKTWEMTGETVETQDESNMTQIKIQFKVYSMVVLVAKIASAQCRSVE